MVMEIAVDKEKLAEIIGWEYELKDWKDQAAARTITDTFQIKGPAALTNARAWIEDAYQAGLDVGMREVDDAWRKRIRRIFDL
jgi:hypothetical protein